MELTVEFTRDERIYFRTGLMSAKDSAYGPIEVSQSLNGARIFVTVKGETYVVQVDALAQALVEAVVAERRDE